MNHLELALEFNPIIIALGASIISFLGFEHGIEWMRILWTITLWENSIWHSSQRYWNDLEGKLEFICSRKRPRPSRKPPDPRSFKRKVQARFLRTGPMLFYTISLFLIKQDSRDKFSRVNSLIVTSISMSEPSAQTTSLNPSIIADTLSRF